ncbi:metallophosphoesterase [Methylosinus trichosporium]|uniref:metallophosphoesterase n=1 Tax=Methylosinus trichosporium TaxID=426 RepID=UPI0024BACE21|nr:metallophosphoesterase [Methylosinus trichosporium]
MSADRITETSTIRSILFRRLAAVCAFALEATTPADAASSYVWAQFTTGGLQARAVTRDAACPPAQIDGVAAAMTPRASPDADFPILVCTLDLPRSAGRVSVDGAALALPPPRVDRLVVIGDTGCRLKGLYWQECNSPDSWPFAHIATSAAATAPGLVLHVGDYYYRESACPPLRGSCAGSPHGDNWASWEADFFAPAAPLLAAAPFVFVRGNHENCERGRRGWARLLSPTPYLGDACALREPSYSVDLGGPTLVVMDNTAAEDRAVDAALAPDFARELTAAEAIRGPVWYAFHKPIYSTIRVTAGATIGDNKTLGEAARAGLPSNVQALLSGHLHTFQAASYVEDYPIQIVAGHGGDAMDLFMPANFDGLRIDRVTVAQGRSVGGVFGFVTLEREKEDWLLNDRDAEGKPLLGCLLRGRKLDCDRRGPSR